MSPHTRHAGETFLRGSLGLILGAKSPHWESLGESQTGQTLKAAASWPLLLWVSTVPEECSSARWGHGPGCSPLQEAKTGEEQKCHPSQQSPCCPVGLGKDLPHSSPGLSRERASLRRPGQLKAGEGDPTAQVGKGDL